MLLENKVAIVTGGGRGIGAEYCRGLAAEGARVVVADIISENAQRVAGELGGIGCHVDVSDESSVARMVESTLAQYGRVDVLVNNAAIFTELIQPRKDFDAIPVEEWDRVMAINVRGVWLCSKAVAPVFREQRSGAIINISSGTIHGGQTGFAHYVTSKAAVWGLTRVLARELGDYGVRVNVITPGLTSSEVVRTVYPAERLAQSAGSRILKREEQPSDLVGTVIFLASDLSAFITGQTINVDGGQYLH
ncbi:MAG: 3-oxoacyl-ACP reductase FabG [Chloroflexi bacterium]|nr:3-oxoacyl-ACP reductase FabG [Chloroflexota bacterium]